MTRESIKSLEVCIVERERLPPPTDRPPVEFSDVMLRVAPPLRDDDDDDDDEEEEGEEDVMLSKNTGIVSAIMSPTPYPPTLWKMYRKCFLAYYHG